MIVISLLYLVGYILAFSMLKVEHVSESEPYTYGARVLMIVLSFLSWLMILWLLISAWIYKINSTGYWSREIKNINVPEKPESK